MGTQDQFSSPAALHRLADACLQQTPPSLQQFWYQQLQAMPNGGNFLLGTDRPHLCILEDDHFWMQHRDTMVALVVQWCDAASQAYSGQQQPPRAQQAQL